MSTAQTVEQQIHDDFDTVYLPPGRHATHVLHLEEDCPNLARADYVREKPIAVFPVGHKDICGECLRQYKHTHQNTHE